MDFEMVGVRCEELSYRVAHAAHSGTSFSPEERARQEQQAYYNDVKAVYDLFADKIRPEQETFFLEEMTRYRRANLSRRLDYLHSRSRVLSPMITGPAKFPTRSKKRSRAYENKVKAFAEWRRKAIYRIGKTLGLSGSNSISGDDKDATEQLRARITLLETRQARMKEINGIRIIDNVEENRIQLFFPDKPSDAMRSELKRSGFRWAPSIGAWQRMRSYEATERAKEIINRHGTQQGGQR